MSTSILNGQTPSDTYPDITDGTQVVVVNSNNAVIATGTLKFSNAALYDDTYNFTVTVPGGLPRYGIQIGHNRGTIWETPSQMKQGPSLCLGDGC